MHEAEIWMYGQKLCVKDLDRIRWLEIDFLLHVQYNLNFYMSYLSRWPDMCYVQEAPTGRLMGYGNISSFSLYIPLSSSRCTHPSHWEG